MNFDHIHFYVENLPYWHDWFAKTLNAQPDSAASTVTQLSSASLSLPSAAVPPVGLTSAETTKIPLNGVQVRLSTLPQAHSSSHLSQSGSHCVPEFHYPHPAGVKDVAFRVDNLDLAIERVLDANGQLLTPIQSVTTEAATTRQATVLGWGNLHHTLIEAHASSKLKPAPDGVFLSETKLPLARQETWASARSMTSADPADRDELFNPTAVATAASPWRSPQVTAIDHVVLNVPKGELEPAVAWYMRAFGFQRQQQFSIKTERSALHSQVLEHPHGNVQFPINEPASPHSQIQEFLDAYGGSGIQHIALRTDDIIATVAHMRQQGVQFLDVPPTYYQQLQQRQNFSPDAVDWQAIARLKILADWRSSVPEALLLQTFTQPLFGQPTFFFEMIQRQSYCTPQGHRVAQGFGEGNFQALFEAIEREQIKRGRL